MIAQREWTRENQDRTYDQTVKHQDCSFKQTAKNQDATLAQNDRKIASTEKYQQGMLKSENAKLGMRAKEHKLAVTKAENEISKQERKQRAEKLQGILHRLENANGDRRLNRR